ncbi:MAG TPA: hypothetical protein EYP85_14135 [Armatimonadetes bacterium]|nr:hypothetical protein [Armatimonadota bacterium]
MKERLQDVGRVLAQVARAIWRFLVQGGRWVGQRWYHYGEKRRVHREIRRLEARQRELYLQIGQQVYLLFQRNNVRNRDILVRCEEIRELEVKLDQQREKAVQIAAGSILPPPPAEGPVQVASEPLEMRHTSEVAS